MDDLQRVLQQRVEALAVGDEYMLLESGTWLSIIVTRAANRPVTTLNVVTANGAIPQPLRRFWITMMTARIEEIHVQSSSEPPWPAHMAAIL